MTLLTKDDVKLGVETYSNQIPTRTDIQRSIGLRPKDAMKTLGNLLNKTVPRATFYRWKGQVGISSKRYFPPDLQVIAAYSRYLDEGLSSIEALDKISVYIANERATHQQQAKDQRSA